MKHILSEDFDPVSAKAWKQKIQFDLKGADYNDTLLSHTAEGITIKPFYHMDDFEKLTVPANNNPFKVSQTIELKDVAEANDFAIKAASSGVENLRFNCADSFDISAIIQGISTDVKLQ